MAESEQRRLVVSLKPTGALQKYFISAKDGNKGRSKYGPPLDQYTPESSQRYHLFRVSADKPDSRVEVSLVNGKSYVLVGRGVDNECDVLIRPPFEELVSKEHCVFQFRQVHNEVKLYVIDLKSTNGTWLNGNKIPSKRYVELKHGDRVRLGEWDFVDEETSEVVYEGIEFIVVID